jgi:hypothetical protein
MKNKTASDWFGWIKEIPGVNCQEAIHDELIEYIWV